MTQPADMMDCFVRSVVVASFSSDAERHLQSQTQHHHKQPHPSSFCGISFLQKFWRDPPNEGVKQGWGRKTNCFLVLCVNISKTVRYTCKLLLMTTRKLHMVFRLPPTSMTLDDLELQMADGRQCFQNLNQHNSGCIQHRDMIFGSRVGFFSGSADLMAQLSNFRNPRWRLTVILDIQKWPYLNNRFADRADVWFQGGVSG